MATAGDSRGVGPERAFHPTLEIGASITLDADESGHLVRVRRVQAGEPVVCFDGAGRAMRGTLTQADPRAAVVALEAPYPSREPAVALTVAVSMPEPARADAMIFALAELGVTRVRPILCARTPPKRRELVVRRTARWHRAAREAAKVNGRATLMQIDDPVPCAEVWSAGGWLLDPDPSLPLLAPALATDARAHCQVALGPEGGFTTEERDAAVAAGLRAVQWGASVLRTGTAAVAVAAVCLGVPPATQA